MHATQLSQFVDHLLAGEYEERLLVDLENAEMADAVAEELRRRGFTVIREPFKARLDARRTTSTPA